MKEDDNLTNDMDFNFPIPPNSWWCQVCITFHPKNMYCTPTSFYLDKTGVLKESQKRKLLYFH